MAIAKTNGSSENAELPTEEFSEKESLQISVFQNTIDHRYIVSFKNQSSIPVKLCVLDEKGKEIYSENVNGNGIYNRRFDLINLNKGEYTVKIGNQFNQLEKDVIIK
jgi:hypothetical protein